VAIERRALVLRIEPEIYNAVVEAAMRKGLSMNDYVSGLMAKAHKIPYKPRGGSRGFGSPTAESRRKT